MKLGKYTVPEVRKFLIAAAGGIVILLNSALEEFAPFLPEPWPAVINSAVGILTAVGVFLTKNAPIIDAVSDFNVTVFEGQGGGGAGGRATPLTPDELARKIAEDRKQDGCDE